MTALLARLHHPDTAAAFAALAAGLPATTPVSLTLPLPSAPQDWLNRLPAQGPWWYHARPARGECMLGIGHACHWSSAGPHRLAALAHAFAGLRRHWPGGESARAFCGFAFSSETVDPLLPNALLAVPALLLTRQVGRCRAVLTAPAGALTATLRELDIALASRQSTHLTGALRPTDETLADQAWLARVGAALRDIDAGRLAKVVLARRRQLRSPHPVSAAAVLSRLVAQQPDSVVYGHGHDRLAFVGATPERLVRLRGRQATADALAGTAWPGSPSLEIDKNRHEQSLVVDAVMSALARHGSGPPVLASTCARSAGRVSHLRNKIRVDVAPGCSIFDLMASLHPTPAVGGWPGAAADDWLRAHSEVRSAWYSGGVGWLDGNGDGDIAVALRSALIDGERIELQAGAGIVTGSHAPTELAETEAKFGTLLDALNGRHPECHATGTAD